MGGHKKIIWIISVIILAAAAFAAVWFLIPGIMNDNTDTAGLPIETGLDSAEAYGAYAADILSGSIKGRWYRSVDGGPSANVAMIYAIEEAERREAEEAARLEAEALEAELAMRHDPVTIAFAGDILFDQSYAAGATIAAAGGLAASLDAATLDVMTSADLMVINNEFPYTASGSPYPGKTYTFHAPPYTAEWLAGAGVDVAALANNHIFDYGEAGFLETLETLDNIGMPYIGAGRNLEEASRILYFTYGKMTVALLNATQIERYANSETRAATAEQAGVFKCLDPSLLYSKVREAKENADFVIVFIHWGTEKVDYADYLQEEQAAGLAAAGADLVVGAHPHRVQGVTYYGDTPVIYSIGNFLFTSYTLDVSILQVTLDPDTSTILSLQMIPMQQAGCRVKTLEGAEKARFISELRRMSSAVSIDENGFITR